MVEIISRDVAFADQPKRFRQQRALQPVQHKAVDLAVDRDGHLADLAVDFAGMVDRFRRRPRRAAQFDQRHQSGGLTGWPTRQRARPGSVSVKRDAVIAEVDDTSSASVGASLFELGEDRNLLVDCSGPFS